LKQLFFIFLFVCCDAYAQDIPLLTQQLAEQMVENGADPDDDQVLQQLDFLKRHPIYLNAASKEELLQLPLLNENQILNFLSYRKFAGKLIDLHELQAIPGWDVVLIQKILPYVTLQEPVLLKEKFLSRLKGEHLLLVRASGMLKTIAESGPDSNYLGSSQHILFRYRYQYKDQLYGGITGDKDAGEQFFRGYQNHGFDFYSFHFFMKNIGIIKTLALGDYTVNLGQGLLSWQATGFGKSAEVMAIKRSAPALAPYRSSGEFNFYRGAALTLAYGKLGLTGFFSRKFLSAHIDDSAGVFTAIDLSGLHRTEPENNHKNQVLQFSYGGRIQYHSENIAAGINFLSHHFNIPLIKKEIPYNRYAFSGKDLTQVSLDFGYTFRNLHLFGECASEINFHPALVSGLLISVDRWIDLSFLYRNFSRNFHSLFGNAFSENSLPVNENGFFSGIDFHPAGKWQFHAYADVFSFPWLKFRVDAPSRGSDFLIQAEYHPTRQAELNLQYKIKNKPLNDAPGSAIDFPFPEFKKNLRVNLVNQVNNQFRFSARFEALWYSIYEDQAEKGFLGYLQADFQVRKKIKTVLRYQYFETDSYNSRVYAYEPDVQSSFSIPAFSGKGSRYLVQFNYPLSKRITFCGRYTLQFNRNDSYLTDHSSNLGQSEIKFQAQVIF